MVDNSQRNDLRRFVEKVSENAILGMIRESIHPDVTAGWVADTVGMKQRPVQYQLPQLNECVDLKCGKSRP